MTGYTDIHSHIIPGVDDGAKTLDESLRMLCKARDEGVRTIIATPHFGLSNPEFEKHKVMERFNELKAAAYEKFPDMSLLPGAELFWSDGMAESLKRGEACTLAGTDYVLVEFDYDAGIEKMEDAVEKLKWNGYLPIIAHAERCRDLTWDPEKIESLTDQGAYIQVNCRSLIPRKKRSGLFAKTTERDATAQWALEMLKRGFIHFIASDMHGVNVREPIYEKAVTAIKATCGEEMANRIIFENINKLLSNKRL